VSGLARERDLPNITERLVERGWPEPDIRKLLGENWLRVFRASL
jgi:microsomal dipeptidase-like Zn-dependent dipeptidase